MDRLRQASLSLLHGQHFDSLSVATIDLQSKTTDSFDVTKASGVREGSSLCFDLASITKALTLSGAYLAKPDLFNDDMLLLLEHRAGLPSWARLSKDGWRQWLMEFPIKDSPTEYSDLCALRLQIEIEKRAGRPLYDICRPFWDEGIHHWSRLPKDVHCPVTGFRQGRPVSAAVDDDNAFCLGGPLAHAGLFSTSGALARTLVNLDTHHGLVKKMAAAFKRRGNRRFLYGMDTARGGDTLAGPGHSPETFGHLGFTGTSFWIDIRLKKGLVVLSNACYPYKYHRKGLNALRKKLGALFWRPKGASHGEDRGTDG